MISRHFSRCSQFYIYVFLFLSPISYAQTNGVNGWFISDSDSRISTFQNGIHWSPVRKPTTIHRYFNETSFEEGDRITLTLNWESDGEDSSRRDFDCSDEDPTDQGTAISDRYLRCLAGTGDFRIGLFQSNTKIGSGSCEGNSKKENCDSGESPTRDFDDYRGFQFRIHPHLSRGYEDIDARLKEEHSDGDSESHINLNLWSRIDEGEHGLMSDECQAEDHCGFSKSDDWGTQPVSWGPDMPFGEARELRVEIEKASSTEFEVYVTLNNARSPRLTGRFRGDFNPSVLDTLAITYTNSSRKYAYVNISDIRVNGQLVDNNNEHSLIQNIRSASSAYYYATSNIQNNDDVYLDRDYVFTRLGDYSGMSMLKTSNDDESATDSSFLQFSLTNAARVHVLYDTRADSLPAWLATWSETSDIVETDDADYRVYFREFPEGEVTLGANQRSVTGARSMYTVLIAPITSTPSSTPLPPDPDPQPPTTKGPGLGNLSYSINELFEPISIIESKDGHGNVAMVNGYLMVIYSSDGGGSSGDGGFEFWDVSNPKTPTRVKRYDNTNTHRLREAHGFSLATIGQRDVLAAQSIEGIQFWDVSDPINRVELISELSLPGINGGDYSGAWWVFWQAPYAFIAGASEGVFVVDASNINTPEFITRLSTSDLGNMRPGVVFALGNLLVVSEHSGDKFSTLDISDPTSPVLLDTFRGEEGYSQIFAAGKILVSGSEHREMHAYNVSHSGEIEYFGSKGDNLGRGGYGSYQDGYFISGFSDRIAKIQVNELRQVGTGTSNLDGRDEDFGLVLGNLVFAGDDHGKGSALIPHQPTPDRRSPEVTWVHPKSASTGVALSARIGVSMSDNIELSSITPSSFRVRDAMGHQINGTYSVQMGLVNFTPSSPLAPNTEYQITIEGLEDWAGNASPTFTSRFTTQGDKIPNDNTIISNINQNYSVQAFSNNMPLYEDRDYTFSAALPDELLPALYIQTENDDKGTSRNDFLQFNLSEASMVSVFYDARVNDSDVPSWLNNWDEPYALFDTTDVARRLFVKRFEAGEVVLGGNAPARSMYSVLITPITTPEESPTCDLGELAPIALGSRTPLSPSHISGTEPIQYSWKVNQQDIGESPETAFTFTEPGRHLVSLSVANRIGNSQCTATQIVHEALREDVAVSSSSLILADDHYFVINPDNNTLSKLDRTGELVWEVQVGKKPHSITFAADNNLWISLENDSRIAIVDPASGTRVRNITLATHSQPRGIVSDDEYVYVLLSAKRRLLKLNLNAERMGRALVPPDTQHLTLDSMSQRLYVPDFIAKNKNSRVVTVDTLSMTRGEDIHLSMSLGPDTESDSRGLPNYLSQFSISPSGSRAWVPSKKDNIERGLFRDGNPLTFESEVRAIASHIDLNTSQEILSQRIDINDREMPRFVAHSPLGDLLFVAMQGSNTIEVFDAYSLTRLNSIHTARAPVALLVDDLMQQLVVHNFLSRSVSIFDIEELLSAKSLTTTLLVETALVENEQLSDEVLRGKRIFYNANDRRMNRDGYLSCASCHLDGGHDGQVWDFTQNGEGLRNTITLQGRAGTAHGNLHWTANFDEVQDFEHDIRSIFGGQGFLTDDQFNTTSPPLGRPKAGLSTELDALAAYVSSLTKVPASPFRKYSGELSDQAIKGKSIFYSNGCASCHSGSQFTDRQRHDVGTLKPGSGLGRNQPLTGVGFETPSLKGVWATAPYFHDGSAKNIMATLTQPGHGNAQSLNREQLNDLAAFVKQIDENTDVRQTEQNDSPVAIYNFEKNYEDSGNHSLHATRGGRASFSSIEMQGEHAIKLEQEEGDYVSLPSQLGNTQSLSFAAWIRWDGGAPWQRVVSMNRDRDNLIFFTVSDRNGYPRFRIEKDGVKHSITLSQKIPIKTYTHIAFTLNNGTVKIYIDGKKVDEKNGFPTRVDTLNLENIWLGKSAFDDPYFDGRMDDVRFYHRTLNEDEINRIVR